MDSFWTVLRDNPNYRYTWMGQVVSEIGDHFNSIAVLSLAVHLTNSGVAVGGVMIARTVFAIVAGPIAGVVLDRSDRKKIMIASDLFRAVVALGFVLILTHQQRWLLYVLSGMLMFASPFFTSGRSAILPRITTAGQLHTANALTQTTAWLTLSFGTLFGGVSTMEFGYEWAFIVNALSFVFSAWAIWKLRSPEGHFRPDRAAGAVHTHSARAYWADFADSLRYMRSTPLILAIALAWVGWATGGGAAQILFTLYGELVFRRGPAGIGIIWSAAGFGLVAGGFLAHWMGRRLTFAAYRHTIHPVRDHADHRAGFTLRRIVTSRHGCDQRPQPHHDADTRARPLPRTGVLHRGDDDERDHDDLAHARQHCLAQCAHTDHRSGGRMSQRLHGPVLAARRRHGKTEGTVGGRRIGGDLRIPGYAGVIAAKSSASASRKASRGWYR